MIKLILRFGLLSVLFFLLMELGRFAFISAVWYQEFLIVLVCLALVSFGFILRKYWVSREEILATPDQTQKEKLKLLGISDREFEVLIKISEGLSNQDIASHLFISENTVKTHLSNIFSKLNAKRRTEAINKARKYGLL